MLVADQDVGTATVPLKRSVLVPCVVPRFVPVTVTGFPTAADVGDADVSVGVGMTVNATPVLVCPDTVTVTGPVVAPEGTMADTLVALQLVGLAAMPLNRTRLVPAVVPKLLPEITTAAPTPALVGVSDVIDGGGTTVNVDALLAVPATVTLTAPVTVPVGTVTTIAVFVQLVIVASLLLRNVTVPPSCWSRKFVPAIVTDVPTPPFDGDRLVMVGAGRAFGIVTVES